MQRNRREMSRPRASLSSPLSPEYQAQVEFISEARHNFGVLNQPQHGKPSQFYPTHNYRQSAPLYGRILKLNTSWTILVAFLIFMALVIAFGLHISGGDFVPGYEPPAIYQREAR